MKYLFIFLPFFAFGQSNTLLYGVRFIANSDTCWEIKNGWMSLKPGCISIPKDIESVPVRKVVETFHYNGHKYDLYEDGWRKLVDTLPDYLNGDIRIKGDSVFRWSGTTWKTCDQHIGTRNMPKRDKIDRTRAKILVWNGCALKEIEVYKITHYNEMTVAKNTGNLAVYISETIRVDVAIEYLYDGGWIKNSHVIKELWSE